jgi:chaperonin GroEL
MANAKEIVLGAKAREEMIQGVNITANAVKVTLGPRGRYVGIDNGFGAPKITKDGVTVAKHTTPLKDPIKNMGAQLVKNVASAADTAAGDGTTTATVLTQALVLEANRHIVAGSNPMDLKRGIELAGEVITQELIKRSKKVSSKEEITQVATISANGDQKMGKLVAEAIEISGIDGTTSVDEGKSREDILEKVNGIKVDRGFISAHFVTDKEKMTVELENPLILLFNEKVSTVAQILPLLEKISQTSKSLLIVADDVDGEALAMLVINKIRGILKVAAIKAPGFGDRKKAMLEDISILTNGQVISEEIGLKLENAGVEALGKAAKVIITKDFTTIIDGEGKEAEINARCNQLKQQINETTSDYDKEKLQERLATLRGGVAVLKVGGITDVEVKERKERFEDALNATKAAKDQGIVSGGGTALLYAAAQLENVKGENHDQQFGISTMKKALEMPLRQIVENAGVDGAVVVGKLLEKKDLNYGFDAQKLEYTNMIDSGIIDPTKVVISALKNAISVAVLIITTEGVITEKQEENTSGNFRGGMPGGDMDGMGF